MFKRTIYIFRNTDFLQISVWNIYVCIEIRQETTTCWLRREFSTSKAVFGGHILNFSMSLFCQQISTFLEVPSPNDKWCQKIRPSGPVGDLSGSKKHLHKVLYLSFFPSVCKTTIQYFSPWEKKTRENWWLVTPGFPKSTIHWTETLPQKPTKNPGRELSTMLLGITWIQLLGPFQVVIDLLVCCNIAPTLFLTTSWN